MDWRNYAACRDVDPELFFPIGNTGPALLQIDEAKQVCARCKVAEACLRRLGRTQRGRKARAQAARRAGRRRRVAPSRAEEQRNSSHLISQRQRHLKLHRRTASWPSRYIQPPAELTHHQRPDDLQAEARRRVKIETVRESRTVVGNGHM